MARGRRRQSDELKALKGNPHGHKLTLERAAEAAAEPPSAAQLAHFEVPSFLTSRRSRDIFGRVIDDYIQNRIARRPDLMAYGRWAYYVDRWIGVKEKLERKPLIYETKSKHGKLIRKHPHFQAMTDLERLLQSLEDRLGLNPVARQNYLRGLAALPAPLAGLFDEGRQADKDATSGDKPSLPAADPLGFLQRATTPIDKLN